MKVENESVVIDRDRCPSCAKNGADTSGDNLAIYDDGHSYCFSCGYYDRGNKSMIVNETFKDAKAPDKIYEGECIANPSRKIKVETAKRYNYQTCKINGKNVEIANFYLDGKLVSQHMRGPEKKFYWNGKAKATTLWGQHLWRKGGKRIFITEGEYDCMSVYQILGGRIPVVSLPNGAASAAKSIKDNLEWVCSHDEINICFDQDEAGKAAAEQVAELLPPGRVKIITLPGKDANECLVNDLITETNSALWNAHEYSPDEIMHVSRVIEASQELSAARVYPFPFNSLTVFLIGQRSGEITLWCSGTGSGKSTIVRELMHHHLEEGRSVGAIMLEESPQETMDDMVSLMLNKPVRAI